MVARTMHDEKDVAAMDAQPLKFGMDRILSGETSSKAAPNVEEFGCSSSPPCASCLASLYRCCRNSSSFAAATSGFYKTVAHAPQPLGPYANASVKADSASLEAPSAAGSNPRRKRSWSRAVFSNLQRKGLEKRFQLQKYITKPDRRQLAATLGLSDAQVKVWFQNRRMKWRHAKEAPRPGFDGGESGVRAPGESVAESARRRRSDADSGSDVDVQTVDA